MTRALREVIAVMVAATIAIEAFADDELPPMPGLPIPYLHLRTKDKIRTRGGTYFATGDGSMRSAIRMTGPNVTLDLTDSSSYAYFFGSNGIYVRQGGVADVHRSHGATRAVDAHAYFADGAALRADLSDVRTFEVDSMGLFAAQPKGYLRFDGGSVSTLASSSYGAYATEEAVLEIGDANAGDGKKVRTKIVTRGDDAPGVYVHRDAELKLRGTDIESYGSRSPAVVVDHARATIADSTFRVDVRGIPHVVVKNGGTVELNGLTFDSGERTDGGFLVDRESKLVVSQGAQLRGPHVVSIGSSAAVFLPPPRRSSRSSIFGKTYVDPLGENNSAPRVVVSDRASIAGGIEVDPDFMLKLDLRDAGQFEGDLNGHVAVDVGPGSTAAFVKSTRVDELSNTGVVAFASSAPVRQSLWVDGSMRGANESDATPAAGLGTLRLRTLLNSGGAVSAQQTDRVLVSGDVAGVQVLDVVVQGDGALTDTNADGITQPSEGISLVQVAGRASEHSFVLPGGVLAVGPYRYELMAFAPGASAASQRLVSGDGGYWDFRLKSRIERPAGSDEEGAIVPAPEPAPEPVVEPVTDPVEPPVVEPPVVEPPVVEPPVVEPPVVEPPVVEPPVVEPPVVEPPAVEPPVVETPVVEPPAVEPPVVEPPVVEPPAAEPPVIEPPVAEPAATDSKEGPDGGAHIHTGTPQPGDGPAPEVPSTPAATIVAAAPTDAHAVVLPPAHAMTYVSLPAASTSLLRSVMLSWGTRAVGVDAGESGESGDSDASTSASASASVPRHAGFATIFGGRQQYRGGLEASIAEQRFTARQRGVLIGLPVYESPTANGKVRIDIGASVGESGLTVSEPDRGDNGRIRTAGLGVQVSHTHPSGAYQRVIAKVDAMAIDVRNARGRVASTGGTGLSMLGEMGFAMALACGWRVEPSIAVSYIDVRIGAFNDAVSSRIDLSPDRTTALTLGARLMRPVKHPVTLWRLALVPYLKAGVTIGSGPSMTHQVAGQRWTTHPEGTSLNGAIGVVGHFGKRARLDLNVETDAAIGPGSVSTRANGNLRWMF